MLQSILDLAAPEPGRRILEVGPGLGILTGGLLDGGASVTAVELDRRLADRLARTQSDAIDSGALRLVQGDILDQRIAELIEAPYEVVANVPYHITSPILHRFLGEPPRPERLVLMLQREVAERISATPGDMSYLSVFVQYHAAVRIAFVVPREAFEPAPDVESAVVEIRPLDPGGDRPRLSSSDEDDLWRLVQAGFRERRKKLHNVLSRQLTLPGAAVTRGSRRGRDRRRPPAADSVGGRVAGPAGCPRDRLGMEGAMTTDRRRRRPHPRRPLRAGQAEPDSGRGRSSGRRLPRPPLDHGAAVARRCPDGIGGACRRGPRFAPDHRL